MTRFMIAPPKLYSITGIFPSFMAGQAEKGIFSDIMPFVLMLIGTYVAMLIQIVFHEAGHLIFGLMTGYRFSSFRIANLMWVKLDGRIQFRKLHIAGTGGQCLMIPPDLKDGKIPPFDLINGLPIKMGAVNNDGKNALDLSHSEEATQALWIQMKVNEQISKGLRLKDMPDEWFRVPSDESMKNGLIATIGVLACNRLIDQQQFDEADTLMKRLLSQQNGIVGLYRNLMVCDQMDVEMISKNRKEILDEMRTRDQMKVMKAMKKYPSVLRTEYVYTLLAEQNPKKAEKLMAQFRQCAKSYPYPSEIEGESQLMTLANERITSQQE